MLVVLFVALAIGGQTDGGSPTFQDYYGWGQRWANLGLDNDPCLQSFASTMDRPHYLSVPEDRQTVYRKAQVHAGLAVWSNREAERGISTLRRALANLEPQYRRGDISLQSRDSYKAAFEEQIAAFSAMAETVPNDYPACRFQEAF